MRHLVDPNIDLEVWAWGMKDRESEYVLHEIVENIIDGVFEADCLDMEQIELVMWESLVWTAENTPPFEDETWAEHVGHKETWALISAILGLLTDEYEPEDVVRECPELEQVLSWHGEMSAMTNEEVLEYLKQELVAEFEALQVEIGDLVAARECMWAILEWMAESDMIAAKQRDEIELEDEELLALIVEGVNNTIRNNNN